MGRTGLLLLLLLPCVVIAQSLPPTCPAYPQPVPLSSTDLLALQPALKQVDLMIEEWVTNNTIGGYIVTVIYDQEIVWSKGYGSSNVFAASAPPPTLDDFVAIASITKVFTDIMLYQLRDAEIVSLDDYVDLYMTNFSVKSQFPSKRRTTLRQLASHTSGLQREVPCYSTDNETVDRNPFSCTEAQILTNIAQTYLIWPPYNTPHYSNLGIALLGRTLQKAILTEYEVFVMQNITQPLGMNATFYATPAVMAALAVGTMTYPNGTRGPAPIVDNGWPTPAGGLLATSRDIAKLMSFFFRSAPATDGSQILDMATVQEMHNPVIVTPDGQSGFGTPLELAYDTTAPYWSLSKAGQLPGYRSQMALIPPLKLGVFVSALNTTVPDDPTLSVMSQPILAMLIPSLVTLLWAKQPPSSVPQNFALYTGEYFYNYSELYGGPATLTVGVLNNTMLANADGTLMNLTQFAPDIFRAQFVNPEGITCRWLDDGPNNELPGVHASSVVFMSSLLFYKPPGHAPPSPRADIRGKNSKM